VVSVGVLVIAAVVVSIITTDKALRVVARDTVATLFVAAVGVSLVVVEIKIKVFWGDSFLDFVVGVKVGLRVPFFEVQVVDGLMIVAIVPGVAEGDGSARLAERATVVGDGDGGGGVGEVLGEAILKAQSPPHQGTCLVLFQQLDVFPGEQLQSFLLSASFISIVVPILSRIIVLTIGTNGIVTHRGGSGGGGVGFEVRVVVAVRITAGVGSAHLLHKTREGEAPGEGGRVTPTDSNGLPLSSNSSGLGGALEGGVLVELLEAMVHLKHEAGIRHADILLRGTKGRIQGEEVLVATSEDVDLGEEDLRVGEGVLGTVPLT